MYSTSSKVQEIILLNRQLRNALSFRGGARKLSDFKEKLIMNKLHIFYIYIICIFTILYFCSISIPKNKLFIGGAPEEGFFDLLTELLDNINNAIYEVINNLYELTKPLRDIIKEQYDIVEDIVTDVHNDFIDMSQDALGPLVKGLNKTIGALKKAIKKIFWSMPVMPVSVPLILMLFYGVVVSSSWRVLFIPLLALVIFIQGFIGGQPMVPIIPTFIVYAIIYYILFNFILDSKIYLPCFCCEEGNSLYKCLPGTGKGTIGCTICTALIDKIKLILKQFKYVGDLINLLKDGIVKALESIIYLIVNITSWFYNALSTGIEKIFDGLKFLKRLEVPDDWGFNFGEHLICPDSNTKGMDCIYNRDGSLREKHGNNPFFHSFWKMIRVILETPPAIPKFPFGGGAKFRYTDIDQQEIKEPIIERHEVDTTVETKSKIQPDDKNLAYRKLLETLIKIEINPIKWIAALFNLLIDAINAAIEQIINLLKMLISFITMLITIAVKALVKVLWKLIKEILKPLHEVTHIALKLPKQLFKVINKILDIGFVTMIIYYFYDILIKIFPFLANIKSFMISMAIIAMIISLLFICPVIGGIRALWTPIKYTYIIYKTIRKYTSNPQKILLDIFNYIYNIMKNNDMIQKLKDYMLNMKEINQIMAVGIILIIVIFIILNMFTNVNKHFITFSSKVVYGHFFQKFNTIKKNVMKYKLAKLEREEKDAKYITNEQKGGLNKSSNILRKLNYTELKKII